MKSAIPNLMRRMAAEFTGTLFLLAAIVGSGIMGERLAGGNVAIALLANSIATGGVLLAILIALGPVSGAHLNPAVTLHEAWQRGISWRAACGYIAAQFLGAFAGVAVAHGMFGLPAYSLSVHARSGSAQAFSECVATFGLMVVIGGCVRNRPSLAPFAVSGYILSAYWFTASTSFANPAVTVARALTGTFSGIRPSDVLPFLAAQIAGVVVATFFLNWLVPVSRLEPVLEDC
jgi:glycerol uptake facilitator-like aquaporin